MSGLGRLGGEKSFFGTQVNLHSAHSAYLCMGHVSKSVEYITEVASICHSILYYHGF